MDRRAIYTTAENTDQLMEAGREWNFHASDTGEHLHGLHPYPAKFIPQIARKAISEWSKRGELVYDPFCGCGTTLLEASRLGRSSVGTDNNAVAILVSRAKTAIYSAEHVRAAERLLERLPTLLAKAKANPALIPSNKNLAYWFSGPVMDRLSALRGIILKQDEPIQTLLMAVFSAIIVKVSYQDSDTRYARIQREVLPAQVDKAFTAKLADTVARLRDLGTADRAAVEIHQADSRSVPFIRDGSVSLVATSPPYLNAYDYHKYHRQRLHWIGGDWEFSRDVEIGTHDEFTRTGATPESYFADMDACFGEWSRVLRRRGKCIVVIGDAIVSKQPVYVADTFIELLANHKLRLKKHWIRELKPTQRAFNVRNSRISHEHVLLLERG